MARGADRDRPDLGASDLVWRSYMKRQGFRRDVFTDDETGLVPASGGGTTTFLRADQSWSVPTIAWGDITGTLSGQTDLQAALDAKAAASHTHDATEVDLDDSDWGGGSLNGQGISTVQDLANWINANITP